MSLSSISITPFYEKALLDKRVLNILCPEDAIKKTIDQKNSLLFEVLENNINETEFNNKKFHKIGKPFRLIASITYVAIVILILSPIAAVYHASLAILKLSKHSINKYIYKESVQKELWQEIVELIKVASKEIFKSIIGTLALSHLALQVTFSLLFIHLNFIPVSILYGPVMIPLFAKKVYGIHDTSSLISFFAGNGFNQNRPEIEIALYLRNEFGLLDKEGGLLKFSKNDQLTDEQSLNFALSVASQINEKILDLTEEIKKSPTKDLINNLDVERKKFSKLKSLITRFKVNLIFNTKREPRIRKKSASTFYAGITEPSSSSDNLKSESYRFYEDKLKKAKRDKQKPHEVFDLEKGYTEQDITRFYKKCSLVIHPDKNKQIEKESTKLFQAYTQLKEELEDPDYSSNWN
jgi:hypothetical protein